MYAAAGTCGGVLPSAGLVAVALQLGAGDRLEQRDVGARHLPPPLAHRAGADAAVELAEPCLLPGRDQLRRRLLDRQHLGPVADLQELAHGGNRRLRACHQILVAHRQQVGAQPLGGPFAGVDRVPPLVRRRPHVGRTERHPQQRQRHVPAVAHQVHDPRLREHPAQLVDVADVVRRLVTPPGLPVLRRIGQVGRLQRRPVGRLAAAAVSPRRRPLQSPHPHLRMPPYGPRQPVELLVACQVAEP